MLSVRLTSYLSICKQAIIITGVGPNGLGEALALAISAQEPGLLILASRTPARLQLVAEKTLSSFPKTKIKTVVLDLSSQKSVHAAVQDIKETITSGTRKVIDVLINNAGINIPKRILSPEGIELQFATNHIGPFLFTNLLLPLILAAQAPRIVNVSSEGHRMTGVRFSDWNFERGKKLAPDEEPRQGMREMGYLRDNDADANAGGYQGWLAYGQSKSANVLFTVSLNEKFARKGLRALTCHPGNIKTDILLKMDEEAMKPIRNSKDSDWKTLDQGAATIAVAAFDPKLTDKKGVYMSDCQFRWPSKWASDPVKAERLWKLSEELVGETFDAQKASRF